MTSGPVVAHISHTRLAHIYGMTAMTQPVGGWQ